MKKELKKRFMKEVSDKCKLYYLSGIFNQRYNKTEIHNLARFISIIKTKPL